MKRLAIVIGSALLVAFTADISSAFTADLPSAYVLCKAHKAGKDGRLMLRKNQCRKREVRINPADYPEFMGPQGVEGQVGHCSRPGVLQRTVLERRTHISANPREG